MRRQHSTREAQSLNSVAHGCRGHRGRLPFVRPSPRGETAPTNAERGLVVKPPRGQSQTMCKREDGISASSLRVTARLGASACSSSRLCVRGDWQLGHSLRRVRSELMPRACSGLRRRCGSSFIRSSGFLRTCRRAPPHRRLHVDEHTDNRLSLKSTRRQRGPVLDAHRAARRALTVSSSRPAAVSSPHGQ